MQRINDEIQLSSLFVYFSQFSTYPFAIKLDRNRSKVFANSFILITFYIFSATYNLQSFKAHFYRHLRLRPDPKIYLSFPSDAPDYRGWTKIVQYYQYHYKKKNIIEKSEEGNSLSHGELLRDILEIGIRSGSYDT